MSPIFGNYIIHFPKKKINNHLKFFLQIFKLSFSYSYIVGVTCGRPYGNKGTINPNLFRIRGLLFFIFMV